VRGKGRKYLRKRYLPPKADRPRLSSLRWTVILCFFWTCYVRFLSRSSFEMTREWFEREERREKVFWGGDFFRSLHWTKWMWSKWPILISFVFQSPEGIPVGECLSQRQTGSADMTILFTRHFEPDFSFVVLCVYFVVLCEILYLNG
jgi:hypothetical protein